MTYTVTYPSAGMAMAAQAHSIVKQDRVCVRAYAVANGYVVEWMDER